MDNQTKNEQGRTGSQGNTTRVSLLAVVGGYLIYMAWQMVRDTISGASEMSMTTTLILAGLMALGGLGTIAYAIRVWRSGNQGTEEDGEEDL